MTKRIGNTNFFGKIVGAIHTGDGDVHIGGEKSRSFTIAQMAKILKSGRRKQNFEKHIMRLTPRERKQFAFDMKTYGRASMPWRE